MDEAMKNGSAPAHPLEEGPYTRFGLTKREHFAAMAMQGMLARSYAIGEQEPPYDALINWAVQCADDLLRALSANQGRE